MAADPQTGSATAVEAAGAAPAPAAAAAASSGAGADAEWVAPAREVVEAAFAAAGVPLPEDFEVPPGTDVTVLSKKQLRKLIKKGGAKAKSPEELAREKAEKKVSARSPFPWHTRARVRTRTST